MLPGIDIKFANGLLGSVIPSDDGIFGMLGSAKAVPDKFELEKAYSIRGMQDVAKLGIIKGDVDNGVFYRKLKEFYDEAGEGTKLWIMGMPKSGAGNKVSDWFTPDGVTGEVPATKLLDKANGEISLLFTSFDPTGYTGEESDELDEDVWAAQAAAQTFAENYTDNMYSPFIVLLEGYDFTGDYDGLKDLTAGTDNRVAIVIGDSQPASGQVVNKNAANHILAGRLAAIQVHENAGKVKLGELKTLTAYIGDDPAEQVDVESIHDRGYITFRTHVRRAGYYFTDDPLATGTDDDYHYITRRRTIDKAYRIAHHVASREILNDFDVNNDGTISPFYAKTVEGNIEAEIYALMTQQGELSADSTNKDDLGVKARVNTEINVAQTGRLEIAIRVRPKGYARWIEVTLGYELELN